MPTRFLKAQQELKAYEMPITRIFETDSLLFRPKRRRPRPASARALIKKNPNWADPSLRFTYNPYGGFV